MVLTSERRQRRRFCARWLTAPWAVVVAFALCGMLSGCDEDDNETVRPEVDFVYVTNSSSASISGFVRDQESGALTEMEGSPFNGFNSNRDMHVHPSLTTMFVTPGAFGKVLIKAIDPKKGTLSTVSGGVFSINPNADVDGGFNADGDRLYVAENQDSTILGFDFDSSTRQLTDASWAPFDLGFVPSFAAVGAEGSMMYVVDTGGVFYSYSIDSGSGEPAELAGGPVNTSFVSIDFMVADPLGEFMFAVDTNIPHSLLSFPIDPSTGALALGQELDLIDVIGVDSISVHPSGEYVYVSTLVGLIVVSVNRNDGSFSVVNGSPYLADFLPKAAGVSPDGRHLYVAQLHPRVLSGFEIQSDGSLEPLNVPDGDIEQSPGAVLILERNSAP